MASNVSVIRGNIFNTKAQTIVNTVNCVGVMGKGIALVFKLRYPFMFDIYKGFCKNKQIGIGKLWLYKGEPDEPWVLNFPTKFHWKYPSKIEYIVSGLEKFVTTYKEKGITSIAFPMLGTNNGGLRKEEVLPIMQHYLSECDIPVEIYDYDPGAPDDLFEKFKAVWLSLGDTEKKSCGIRSITQIRAMNKALEDNTIQSMIALINYDGVGMKTMEGCFKMVLNYKKEQTLL
jgi:O-acetyl-ADP-ribose deacetylase (regulator of RNase III)